MFFKAHYVQEKKKQTTQNNNLAENILNILIHWILINHPLTEFSVCEYKLYKEQDNVLLPLVGNLRVFLKFSCFFFFAFHYLDKILSSRLSHKESHKEYDGAESITTVAYFLNTLPTEYLALLLMLCNMWKWRKLSIAWWLVNASQRGNSYPINISPPAEISNRET